MDIKVPSVGESITEGVLVRWLKKEGETVREGDPLFELETEKATTEVPAAEGGVLHIRVGEGKTVAIASVVGSIEESEGPPAKKSVDGQKQESGVRGQEAGDREQPPVSPAARRLLAEEGLEAGAIAGTGRGGLVTKEDVLHHLKKPADGKKVGKPVVPPAEEEVSPVAKIEPPAPMVSEAPQGRETRQPMSPIRRRIAERLVVSQQQTATLSTFNEADLSAVQALRARYKERFREQHGVNLGLMSFFVKATVEALRAYPILNASIDGNDIVLHPEYHIGVAVSTEKGLMVPVLREADRMSFAQIEKTLAELADKARTGKIGVPDLQGGTFTITNGGVFGSLLSTPILNPPQSAILGLHAIQKRPVAVEDQVVIRPMMYLALSYDHRLIDGRDAVRFLVRVKECIETPERMLLEI